MKVFRIAMLICAVCCFAAPVLATSSRVASMGGGDDYFEDVNNVLRWYGSLASYDGTALFEFGATGVSGGALNRRAASILAELGGEASWGVGGLFLYGDDPDEVIRLAWGKSFGAVQIGLQWQLTWENDTYWHHGLYGPLDYETMDQTFGLGGRFELGPRTYMDAAVDIVQTYRGLSADSGPDFGAGYNHDTFGTRVRLFHGMSERTAIVPVLEFSRALHPEFNNGYYDHDQRDYLAGLGWNHLPDSDTMLVGSFTYDYTKLEDLNSPLLLTSNAITETRNTYLTRFGVERRMLSWLTLRAGAWQMLWNSDESVQSDPGGDWTHEEFDGEDMKLNLGIALHLGPFDADFVFNDATPFNVGGLFAQTDDYAGTTWTNITLQYVF